MIGRRGRLGRSRRRRYVARAGFGLLEVLVAVSVFVVAIGALTTSLVTSTSLVHGNRESAVALDAVQSVMARLRTTPFDEVFARYNADPTDDPDSESPGRGFAVDGLTAAPGDADGLPGRIDFPGNGFQLLENVVDRGLGMPRDLDGDGAEDGADHATDYRILPVRIVVDWSGQGGVQHLEFVTALSGL